MECTRFSDFRITRIPKYPEKENTIQSANLSPFLIRAHIFSKKNHKKAIFKAFQTVFLTKSPLSDVVWIKKHPENNKKQKKAHLRAFIPYCSSGSIPIPDFNAPDLAANGLGQFIYKFYHSGIFIGS